MKKFLTIASLLAASVGCVNVQPVGPMAKMLGDKPLLATKKPANAKPGEGDNTPLPAPAPVPPAEIVLPEDVAAENPQAAAKKLQTEFEEDRKTMPAAPRTAEVSIYKGGQKVQ